MNFKKRSGTGRLLTVALMMLATAAQAEIKLPAIIGSNMVLQRETDVPLWGHAAAGAAVTVSTSWNSEQYTAQAGADGKWRLNVATPAAGGPYEITFSEGGESGDELKLTNILIGEVWLCSGQSNMEMPLKGYKNQPILHANDVLAEAGQPSLRLFHVERAAAASEAGDCIGSWEVSSAGTAADFSAVGFQFAKRLQQILGVPVGIIQSAWGGTPMEAWTDKASLASVPGIELPLPSDSVEAGRLVSTCLYNGMIAPIAGFGIKGFLWYQGEANRSRPEQYAQLTEAMVSGWRKQWGNEELPFYYVQIAPYSYPSDGELVPWLREAQLKAMDRLPLSGMAVSLDVGSAETIHPPDKTTIANRLLYWALARDYGMDAITCEGPVYRSMEVKENKILLSFDKAPGGLTSFGQELSSFEIAGADRHFYPAKASIVKEGLLVESDEVDAPVAVRYAFKDMTRGHLYNTAGLPASSFRTDDWPAPAKDAPASAGARSSK